MNMSFERLKVVCLVKAEARNLSQSLEIIGIKELVNVWIFGEYPI